MTYIVGILENEVTIEMIGGWMTPIYAYCGLDCETCEAYVATQAGDQAAQLDLLARWRAEYDSPQMTIEAVTCDGCTSQGRLGGYCPDCPVRACGSEKGVENCAHCDAFEGCELVGDFIAEIPVAKANLDAIRAGL